MTYLKKLLMSYAFIRETICACFYVIQKLTWKYYLITNLIRHFSNNNENGEKSNNQNSYFELIVDKTRQISKTNNAFTVKIFVISLKLRYLYRIIVNSN